MVLENPLKKIRFLQLKWRRNDRSKPDQSGLASVMGAIKIQQRGGQNHRASLTEIESLFGEKLS